MSAAGMETEQTAETAAVEPTDAPDQNAEQANGDDLRARIEQGGEFAWEQITKRDQHSSRLANEVSQLAPIKQLVDMAGGTERLVELMTLGNNVQNTPGLSDVVLGAIQNGRYDPPAAEKNGQEEADEWLDPDVMKFRDESRGEIQTLRQELTELRQIAGAADVRSKEQRVKENIELALEEFKGDETAFKEASELIGSSYRNALRAAESGDQAQSQLIDQLASAEGRGVLESALMPVYKRHAAKLVAAQNTSTDQGIVDLSRSTDPPNTNPARPGTPQLPTVPKGRVSDASVQRILEAAARERGIDPRTL